MHKDSRECGGAWGAPDGCLTTSRVPQEPFAALEALKLKCLKGQWPSPASLPSLSAVWAIRALSHSVLRLASWDGLYMLHLTV